MKEKLFTLFALHLGLATLVAQPVITKQPSNQTAIAGSTVTFTVSATGAPPLSYQWRSYSTAVIFTNIPFATESTLVLTNSQPTNRRFAVVITDLGGLSATSSPLVALRVVTPPIIATEPSNQNAVAGESATLSVVAGGTMPLAYQWYFNGQPREGATASNLVFATVQLTNAGAYQVVITNLYGAATSRVATLTVLAPTLFNRITNGPIATDLGQCGGCVWADFDNDGFLDLYVTQYFSPTNFFYRNNRDGTFTRVTQGDVLVTSGYNFTAAAADYDNDGWLDLIVTTAGSSPIPRPNVLFHNNKDATFTRVSAGGVTNQIGYFPTAQWADYDNDGFVDLLITQTDSTETGAYNNMLWHNNGDGNFVSVGASTLVADRMAGWGLLWSDYDNDGLVDAFVISASAGHNFLYHNSGSGAFARGSNSVVATDLFTSGRSPAADVGDYDNDGWPDLFVADGGDRENHLYHNDGAGSFSNVSIGPMLTQPPGSDGRSCAWGDYDNDGYLDLLVEYLDRIVIYRNGHNGTFAEMRSLAPAVERLPNPNSFLDANAWVDYDNDGFLDLYVTVGNVVTPMVRNLFYHNAGNTNGWLEVKLSGTVANRAAIGARIHVKATIDGTAVWQLRELRSGGGVHLVTPLVAHFGLGDATNVETLRVEWPGGTVQEMHNLGVKQILGLTEPARLTAVLSNGQPRFTLKGGRNQTYDIQTSTNLVDWSSDSLATITNFNGAVPIPISMMQEGPQKFYRAILR